MRLIAGLLLLLLGVGWLASEVPLAGSPAEPTPENSWRRTADGWERNTWWMPGPPLRRPALHPTIVALLELFLTLMALLAFADPPGAPSRVTGNEASRKA